jgi:RimJ/RimL family protein N-acetyltransferase
VTEIETARLLLRPWQPDDLAHFTRLLTDPEVTRYIVVHTPFSPEDVAELSARTLEQWERNGFGPWAAIQKATGRWVGRIGLDELVDWPWPHKVEVGWELHRGVLGPGLATEGGQAGVRSGFETVGLERIISVTMAINAASRRVMEKCGWASRASCHGGDRGGLVRHRPGGLAGCRPAAPGCTGRLSGLAHPANPAQAARSVHRRAPS